MAIIVSRNGHDAMKVERSTFSKEDDLQAYLSNNPEALPVDQIREGTKILVLAREFATQAGPIDILAVDERGKLYVIETKLYRNPDKRDVVAQVLDYGAALWRHSSEFSDFRVALSEQVQKKYHVSLEEQISSAFGTDEEGTSALLQATASCLEEGTFLFMVLMDQVHDGLRDLVSYLNANSHFQLYAVELEYYHHDSYEILMPHVFGAEVKSAAAAPAQSARTWTVPEVVDEAERRAGIGWASIVQRVLDWAHENAFGVSCGRGQIATLTVRAVTGEHETRFLQVAANGALYVYFEFLKSSPAFVDAERRQTLLNDINSITGANLPSYMIDRWPRLGSEFLSDPGILDRFLARLKEAMETARS
ncbi:MAG: hypothetical protein C0398_05925 [Coprothermobacter sp.]|nr:hypothetical protein [Coprothermobacter sp.]